MGFRQLSQMLQVTVFMVTFLMPNFYVAAQLEWYPTSFNFQLEQKTEQNQRTLSIQRFVQMPSQSSLKYCFDTLRINQKPIVTLEESSCSTPSHINTNLLGFCVDIDAFQVTGIQRDTFCLIACNEDQACVEIELIIEIRRPLRLPFFDDFSYAGPYPKEVFWVDKHVFVNNTLGVRPVSVGVATFDGLDVTGSPYKGDRGRSDYLTSTYIDLSTYRQQDDVYLSFYTQPKGQGPRPRETDSLVLEFKNKTGEWKKITDYTGLSDNYPIKESPDFTFRLILLTDEYLHRDFQFRFININSKTGMTELWHLDYVRLTHGFVPNGTHTDVAFTALPPSFITPYTSMPISHFEVDKAKYIKKK